MPKLVNYAARFVFLREACFALVWRGGVQALSRQEVARVLGTSVSTVRRLVASEASLASLAADHVDSRRRTTWWQRRSKVEDRALADLLALVPSDSDLDTELVALRLRLAGTVPPGRAGASEPPGPDDERQTLAERFQIAEHGYVDNDVFATSRSEGHPESAAQRASEPDQRLAEQLRAWEEDVTAILDRVVTKLGVPDEHREAERVLLAAVVDGLTLARCLHGLPQHDADLALQTCLARLRDARGEAERAG
jgi:hypothetical protein